MTRSTDLDVEHLASLDEEDSRDNHLLLCDFFVPGRLEREMEMERLSNEENTADADYRRRDRNRRLPRHRHHHRGSGLRYLRPKFAINEVAWLSGRLERSSDGI